MGVNGRHFFRKMDNYLNIKKGFVESHDEKMNNNIKVKCK